MSGPSNTAELSTVSRAFEIIETLKRENGATLTEVAETLDMSTSTAYNYLTTMTQLHYLVNDAGEYRLGMKFYELGTYTRRDLGILETIEPVLEAIAAETGEVAWFIIEEHGKAVYVAKAEGKHAVPTATSLGERVDVHCTAAGKALIAHYPDARVREIIDCYGLPERTENTITDRDDLFDELERVRDRGIAFNDEESVTNLRAVAAPVFDRDEVVAAIAIPGPANRLSGEYFREQLPDVLLSATNELDLKFRYS
ncbi:IclR family transcriptional regulator [Halopenitus sp. POP-27]|uniref:IclR family transcriptional regulator n=1 Tax=Halopenitus sp. POP-27 TaxID=2994425 RepID=UPI002468C4EA|nr:IclR family transcriptional regulator [Halopenitus sp. POP-27]